MNWDLFVNVSALVFIIFVLVLLVVLIVLAATTRIPKAMEFMFQMIDTSTDRNGEEQVTVRVKYRYASINNEKFPPYTSIQHDITKILQVSSSIPDGTDWEDVARDMSQTIYDHYAISGVAIQIVLTGERYAGFVQGYITPIDQF